MTKLLASILSISIISSSFGINEELVNSIKDWLTLNTKINSLQKEMKEIRNEKKKLESNLINIMENNNIDEFQKKIEEIVATNTSN